MVARRLSVTGDEETIWRKRQRRGRYNEEETELRQS